MNIKLICGFSILFFLLVFEIPSLKAQSADQPKENRDLIVSSITSDRDKVFAKMDTAATVDKTAWIRHIQIGLKDVIINAAKSGMENGKYTIHVRFIVEQDGSITNVEALDDPGFGTKKAVEKIVRTGPKWQAAQINGQKVRSYRTQPITFMIFR
ncbi:MAG TPA: energy transducer TonB [Flavisolibacter sp.]|jgi:protein TonB|nr:energy transducer TonB [Flavisolibacter sp.]